MNFNDVSVSVVRVEDANKIIVKIDRPGNAQIIEESIAKAVAAAGRPPKQYFYSPKEIIGQLVLAKLNNSNAPDPVEFKFRRALVKTANSVKTMEVLVDFVDDGHYYQSLPYSSLLPCPESIKEIEVHVKTLYLTNVKAMAWQPTLNHATGQIISNLVESVVWSPAAKYHVSDVLRMYSGPFKAEVMRVDRDGMWHGDLHFLKDGRYISLRDELIANKFATAVKTEYQEIPFMPVTNPTSTVVGNASSKVAPNSAKNPAKGINPVLASYMLTGSKPHPSLQVDPESARNYSSLIRRIHDFHPSSYHDFVWAGIDSARNLFITMPPDLLAYDENAISLAVPTLLDSLGSPNHTSRAVSLEAIFVVPSGTDGSKLTQQLEAPRLGLSSVKFLYSTSIEGDASNCQVLVLTPSKLSQFLRSGPSALKLSALKFLGFIFADELTRNEGDRKVLLNFKAELERFRQIFAKTRLFGVTKTWSNAVSIFFDMWFSKATPLTYFLDLTEASICMKTTFSFGDVLRDALPRILLEQLKRLQRNKHRIAIFVPDDYFNWLFQWLKSSNVMLVRGLAPEMVGMQEELTAEFNSWLLSPEKQCILIPDSILRPEIGLLSKPNLQIGATALLHLVSIKDKDSLRARFQLMKPSWSSNENIQCESIFLLESLPRELCNYVNDLLERAGVGKQEIITNWAMQSKHMAARPSQPNTDGSEGISAKPVENSLPLCPKWLETGGRCTDEASCRSRHSFKKEHDDCTEASVPSKYISLARVGREGGRVSVQIQTVLTGSHFIGLLKWPENSVLHLAKIDQMLRQSFRNKSKLELIPTGQLMGAAFDRAGSTLRRVLVLKNLGFGETQFLANSAAPVKADLVHSYRVRLIDHGAIEREVLADKLFPLSPEAAAEPWQSIDVFLCNIRPADGAWPVRVLETLRTKLVGKEVECSVALALRHQLFVTSMVQREICSTLGNERATVTDVRSLLTGASLNSLCAAGVSNPSHLQFLIDKFTEAGLTMSLSIKPSTAPANQPESSQAQSAKVTSNVVPLQSDIEEMTLPLTSAADTLVRISAVHTPGSFFVQRIDSLQQFERMNRAIADWVRQEGPARAMSLEVLSAKSICLAKLPIDEGKCWNRVLIRSVNKEQRNVSVFVIDHGELETIPVEDCRPISTHLASFPAFAIECKLAHVQPCQMVGELQFSNEAGDELWELGRIQNPHSDDKGFSRTFRIRVVEKTKRGYYCRSGVHLVELWPAVELEKETPVCSTIQELGAAAQLVRCGLVAPDWSLVVNNLHKMTLDRDTPPEVNELFTSLVPALLTSAVDEYPRHFNRIQTWLLKHSDLLNGSFLSKAPENVDTWLEALNLLMTVSELGHLELFSVSLDILYEILPIEEKFSESLFPRMKIIYQALFNASRRLLPTAVHLISLTLENALHDSESVTDEDDSASKACILLNSLLTLVFRDGTFAKEIAQLCVQSGIIAVLMHQAIEKKNLENISPCLSLLAFFMNSPSFPVWLRRMNVFKYDSSLSTIPLIETHPWICLCQILQNLIDDDLPKPLKSLLESVFALMASNNDYVMAVEESALGKFIKNLSKIVEAKMMEEKDASAWELVQKTLSGFSMLFTAHWENNYDPEVDSDRFGDPRLRPDYRLPRSVPADASQHQRIGQYLANAQNLDADSFGNILWSQNATHLHLQFDNSAVTKRNLLAQFHLDSAPSRQILRLTLMNCHRSLDVHLFGKVDPNSLQMRDKFSGAELKIRKADNRDWLYLEAPDKRLGNVKFNFDEVEATWVDDFDAEEDEEEEEIKKELVEMKRLIVETGANDDIENSENVKEISADENEGEDEELRKARALLQDFDLDDGDEFF